MKFLRKLIFLLGFPLLLPQGHALQFSETAPAPVPLQLLEQGKISMEDGLDGDAIRLLMECRGKSPAASPVYFQATLLLAKVHLRQGSPEESIRLLVPLVQSSSQPSDLPPASLPEAYCTLAQGYAAAGNWEEAAAIAGDLQKNTDIQPSQQRLAMEILADSATALHTWEKVFPLLEQYLAEHPSDRNTPAFMARLLDACLALKRPEDARKMLSAIPLKNVSSHRLLLALYGYSQLGDTYAAAPFYQAFSNRPHTASNKDIWQAYHAYAQALQTKNDAKAALLIYRQCIPLAFSSQTLQQTFRHAIQCAIQAKELTTAKDLLAMMERKFAGTTDIPILSQQLAHSLFEQGSYFNAQEYFQKVERAPQSSPAQRYTAIFNQAECLRLTGNLPLAKQAFLRAVPLGTTREECAQALLSAAGVAAKQFQDGKTKELGMQAAKDYQTVADRYPQQPSAPEARYQQGAILAELGEHALAAHAFLQFKTDYPGDPRAEEISLRYCSELRLAARTEQELLQAARELESFIQKTTDTRLQDDAVLEAYQTLMAAGKPELAGKNLQTLLQKKHSPKQEQAFFLLILQEFALGAKEQAYQDADAFLRQYPSSPLANEIRMAKGDAYLEDQQFTQARQAYEEAGRESHSASVQPYALLEAGKLQRQCNLPAEAIQTLQQLLNVLEKYLQEEKLSREQYTDLAARTEFLLGEIHADAGRFNEARDAYGKCRNLAGNSAMGLAALGRQGECLLQKARNQGNVQNDQEQKKAYEDADNCFREILKHLTAGHPARAVVLYNLAASLNSQKKWDLALEQYQELYFLWRDPKQRHSAKEQDLFAKAILEMGEILENRAQKEDLHRAIRFYQALANANLPVSPTAAERVKLLRQAIRK